MSERERGERRCRGVNPADPTSIPKYVDPLPIPRVIRPRCSEDGVPRFRVKMLQVRRRLHRCFPKTKVWGYNGEYPGPTFDVRSNEPIVVEYLNRLPKKHFLPIDHTLHGAMDTPQVRTVVHLHGGHQPAVFDGHPEAWFTPFERQVGPFYETNVYRYPNLQQAATLWYHDHALGITRLNVYAGLAGFYLLRDAVEDQLKLPHGPYEVPLVIQDRSFNEDGSLFYPAPCVNGVCPSVLPGILFNTILVNGKVWPFLKVEPRRYRLRLLNGSNTRRYELRLSNSQPFIQIGTDGGFVERPAAQMRLVLFPAERADVIVDFTGLEGQTITLVNTAPDAEPNTTGQVMQFRVELPLHGRDETQIPVQIPGFEFLSTLNALNQRGITLSERPDAFGRPMLLLEGVRWEDPISVTPRLGTTEVWELINVEGAPHPIHVHLVQFQIVNRQAFDVSEYFQTGKLIFTADPIDPLSDEQGWKDTVRTPPGFVTRIVMRFADFPGQFPFHCHILEHEDHDMMRPFEVVAPEPDIGSPPGPPPTPPPGSGPFPPDHGSTGSMGGMS